MKKPYYLLFFFFIVSLFLVYPQDAQALAKSLSGRILLSVEESGEAWYVNPVDLRRYYLGRPTDAFNIMRQLGLGITESDFQQIAQAEMPVSGNLDLARRLSGRIILQVEKNGEAWYINPLNLKKYYLGRPTDAFNIMRQLGLGISRHNLAQIHKPGGSESINQYSSYQHQKLTLEGSTFSLDIIEIDLSNPNLKIKTLAAGDIPCLGTCPAKSLADYVFSHNAFTGFTGSYFCTGSSCGGNNYYFFPVYDSQRQLMINDDQLKYWTTGPLIAFDENNRFYYFKDSRDFKSQANFETQYGVKLQAAIGNKPRLLENSFNTLIDWEVDVSQRNSRLRRNAIAYRDDPQNPGQGKLSLISVNTASLDDLVRILQHLGFEYALNIDGGYSSAMIYNGEYMLGPGRNLPNAIIFTE